jgi:hypothetical protein
VGTALLFALALLVVVPVYFFQDLSNWWKGFFYVLFHQHGGHESFLLGQYSADGWWYYFPVAFLVKTPLGSLVLIAAALIFYRAGTPLRGRNALFLLVPVAFIFLALTRVRINIGVRHILTVYPILFVLASRLATIQFRRAWVGLALLGLPLAATAYSSLRVAPHDLAYFNELAGGPVGGRRYLSDSNLDWGQDLQGLKTYLEREGLGRIYLSYFGSAPPHCYGIEYQYLPSYSAYYLPSESLVPKSAQEILAISVLNLQGSYFQDKDLYRWLETRTPRAMIGYSIYVYDLTGDADAHYQLAQVYLKWREESRVASALDDAKAQARDLAVAELQKVLALEPAHREARHLLSQLGASPSAAVVQR